MPFDFEQDSFKALRRTVAERTSTLIAWVGAGLSADAGLPSWGGLINHLVGVSQRKIASLVDSDKEKGLLGALERSTHKGDYWLAFQLAEELLGPATYQAEIREKLDVGASPPSAFLLLWAAGIQGMISFNLDHFAQQSFSQFKPGGKIDLFIGERAKNLAGVLQRSTYFVGNPHGDINDATTWIFNRPRLEKLLSDPGYRQFINTCLVSRTVVFVGVTADDKAIEDHLATLEKNLVTGIVHYWITHRKDAETDRWAEKLNLRIIRYNSDGVDHSELMDCLDALKGSAPEAEKIITHPVLSTSSAKSGRIHPPDEMIKFPLDEIRSQLNAHALSIFSGKDASAYEKYQKFEEDYDEVIDRAWYVTDKPPKNKVLDYKLTQRVAQGSFGDVYAATTSDGKQVALKLLRRDVRREPAMLQTFRRGVRSMQILQKHNVKGMVNFIDASEIPAFVVMDWIDGPNLMDAVQAKQITGWRELLETAHQLARIVYTAHQLPEGVLHRDLRPPNIMLRDFWATGEIDVVVMDFDLSWHINALEKSIVAKPLGFMAPEQLHQRGNLTRSALVDSFGFGMTFYYMLTGEIPVPDQQKHTDWNTSLKYKIQKRICKQWRSLPFRVMRLVQECTFDRQSERPDFSHITSELFSLKSCLDGDLLTASADYYCEEIAAHAGTMENYGWDGNENRAIYQSGGLYVSLGADIPADEIKLFMKWQQTGEENWKALPKTSAQVAERAGPVLERGGWSNSKFDASLGQMIVEAKFPIDRGAFNPANLAKAVDSLVAGMLPKG